MTADVSWRPPSSWMESDEIRTAVIVAGTSPEVIRAVSVLTAPSEPIRGCMVSSERADLQALQEAVGWTIGGYDTRPSPADMEKKNKDRVEILLRYKQPLVSSTVAMYDYLCETLFNVPVRPVGPEIVPPCYEDENGKIHNPVWFEADEEFMRETWSRGKPRPVLKQNRYPYQLPRLHGRSASHWVLWYLHLPGEPLADPSDDEIGSDLLQALLEVAADRSATGVDYIWYRNPAVSVPDMFHVQVFVLFEETLHDHIASQA